MAHRVEEHVCFMILTEHELFEATIAPANQEAYNSRLNTEQLNKVDLALNDQRQTCDVADTFAARRDGCSSHVSTPSTWPSPILPIFRPSAALRWCYRLGRHASPWQPYCHSDNPNCLCLCKADGCG